MLKDKLILYDEKINPSVINFFIKELARFNAHVAFYFSVQNAFKSKFKNITFSLIYLKVSTSYFSIFTNKC